jgi:hypothetical protein
MSRSGAYYVFKAMERTAMGTPAAGSPRVPARRGVREAPAAARTEGGRPSLVRRVLAAVRDAVAGAHGRTGRDRRGLGGAAQPD